jgi:spore maturation protein CgeB
LSYRLGCTPSWWQLFKALHETGNEVIVVPYLGDPVESLWWRTYPNPCSWESKSYNSYLDRKKKRGDLPKHNENTDTLLNRFAEKYVKKKWEKHLINILEKEKDIEALLFVNVPLNHIKGIPTRIRNEYNIPVAYFDGDMPTILPQYAVDRGFKFNYYVDADLSVYDAFFSNSKGVIPDLEKKGAKNIHPLYYAVDPEYFKPIDIEKSFDISFFGYGSEYREDWMTKMIIEPSKKLNSTKFSIGGEGFGIDMGKSNLIGNLSYGAFRQFCCKSKICLNITRWSHTEVYASSTARPFELAGYGACIVSQPYNGIQEWFDIGKELIIVNSEEEAIETYKWLLSSEEERVQKGIMARQRVLKEHTYKNRAEMLIKIIKRVS